MKAAVYYETGPPDVFRYEEVPDPQCHPNGVLIDVKAVSIEGGDVLNRAGGPMASRPHIVGYQCAGIIQRGGLQCHRPFCWPTHRYNYSPRLARLDRLGAGGSHMVDPRGA